MIYVYCSICHRCYCYCFVCWSSFNLRCTHTHRKRRSNVTLRWKWYIAEYIYRPHPWLQLLLFAYHLFWDGPSKWVCKASPSCHPAVTWSRTSVNSSKCVTCESMFPMADGKTAIFSRPYCLEICSWAGFEGCTWSPSDKWMNLLSWEEHSSRNWNWSSFITSFRN